MGECKPLPEGHRVQHGDGHGHAHHHVVHGTGRGGAGTKAWQILPAASQGAV